MIDREGAEYARIAQNLLAGVGYVGMSTSGEQLFVPPLFPWLILAVTALTGDAEIAGRIVSIVFGSLVVVPVYLIAQRMYGQRIAIGSAALVGIHPLLVEYSTTVQSEPTYLTIILTAIYMSMRAMDNPTLKALFVTGAFYGLAYLVRTEAPAYMLVACTVLALRVMFNGAQHRASLLRRLPVMVLGFLLFAGPYIAWLSLQAGQFRVESKTSLNLPTERLMQHGMSAYEAQFGVEPDLTMRGIWWQSSVRAIKSYNIKIGELPSLLAARAKTVAKGASAVIGSSFAIGSPALFGLAILGLFSRTWTAKLAFDQVHLGMILALVPFAMLFTWSDEIRFYIIFVPVLCLWGTFGVIVFSRWARESAVTVGLCQLHPGKIETASRVLAVSAILLPAAIVSVGHLNAARAERPFKEALANFATGHPEPIRIASFGVPAFEAHAEHVWLPYCDEQTARLFLTKAGVTHVVLRDVLRDEFVWTPYQKKWMEEGIPKAHQIVNVSSKIGRLKIYELDG
jgi:hypothetical protein